MEELQVVNKLGVATSPEVAELVDRSMRATISKLNRLGKAGDIIIVQLKVQRKLYIKNELYQDLFQD